MFPDTLAVSVVGSYTGPDGRPLTGYVYYESTVDRVMAGSPPVVVRCSGRMQLGETGEARGVWLDPNGAGVSPAGFNYKVTEAFHGCETSRYTVSIPSGTPPGTDLDLATLPRVTETT